jgi:class 3 adenylate cyclase
MSPSRFRWAGFFALLALSPGFLLSGLAEKLDLGLLDGQYALLREWFPRPAGRQVVVVGIDDASARRLPEPMTLWHPHLGRFLEAMALARPALVGIDLVLPERSMAPIVPGYDRLLLRGIIAARESAPLVLAVTVEADGRPRPLYPPLLSAAGAGGSGFALWRADADHVVRRFDERLGEGGAPVATFAGALARRAGVEPGAGLVDFSRGAAFGYVPFYRVLEWYDAGDRAALEGAFAGRAVLLGSVLPFVDRQPLPVNLAAWESGPGNAVPGVLLNAQALRCLLDGTQVREAPVLAVLLLALAGAALWWLPLRPVAGVAAAAGLALAAVAASGGLLHQGVFLPVAWPLATGVAALVGRGALETGLAARERARLRRAFSGYVSPQILADILEGRLAGELGGRRFRLCVLFADVRNFTARSEALAPEAVIGLLNRYFEGVTAAIHARGGTVDKFIGDGIMAFFGAPQPLDNPAQAGFAAARAMLEAVDTLNAELGAEGVAPIAIGIGLHLGDAVVGHVGAAARHEYTAIGDAVNVASRLEGLTKELGRPLACSRAFVEALDRREGFVYVGEQPLKGHTAVEVYAWPEAPPAH